MGLRSTIGLTGSTSIILVIAILVIVGIYLHNRYMDIFSINFLWEKGFCKVIDDKGKVVVDKDTGSLFGTLFNKDGVYSIEYCAFNPLMLTDPTFRDSAINLYGGNKMFTAIKRLFNGTWRLPDQNLIKEDQVLSSMILNPWYTSDDVFYTQNNIEYTSDLKTFIVDGKQFNGFDEKGLYYSYHKENMYANNNTLEKCSMQDKLICNNTPGLCDCSFQNVPMYYLYMDDRVLIELPMQLYLGKLPDSQTEKISIKVRGKKTDLSIEPLRVKNLEDLERVLDKRFYQFIWQDLTTGVNCNNLSTKDQKLYDDKCKFFQSDALAGIVIALKRIIIINIPESVRDALIEKIDRKISLDQRLDYLQFFLWLAAKSHKEKITYNFIPFNKQKRFN
jgi:hypothetical protein